MSFPNTISSLNRSRTNLQIINSNLNSSLKTLEQHTHDLPRLANVTQNNQFYELVSVPEIKSAQFQLTSELEPQIKQLVNKAELGLKKLQTREQLLRTTVLKREATYNQEEKEEEDLNQHDLIQQEKELDKIRDRKLELVKELRELDLDLKHKQLKLNKSLKAYGG
ncbi:hypothetical protein CROQUDRAFT_100401 [Cronartium quercuum f. sp. fusiforme G11]|uniref:DASH complex subunit SPC19 n=1 Tax=Cronartium quercuum f. sp. fusiforme G11 TaxID=708437 RepID=A0A9P6T6B2_9BASI|nr:hypothetical protein CROQUDRAFT_100401 [Cronartium quercuum f. sp. fusiforme G11]